MGDIKGKLSDSAHFPQTVPSIRDVQEKQAAIQQDTSGRNPTTEELLAERGSQYGQFSNHARLTQTLEQLFFQHMIQFNPEGAKKITPTMKEGLHMIFYKLGRIGNGNPENIDSWDDVAGYSKLVADDLREKVQF